MKKTTTILASLLICGGLSAQINPSEAMNGKMIKSIDNKATMSGNEALSHLIANPNPTTSSQRVASTSEVIIGSTTYDLQTNAAVQNRIIRHADGSISAGWTNSQLYNSSYADRGTGYNYFDGTSWGANPSSSLESTRGGWPSIIAMGSGKEASITHNTANSHLNMTHRASVGSGSWTEQNVSTNNTTGVSSYLIWNRSAVGGLNDETIHMIAVTASTNFGGTPFNGLDGALVYYRSQDEGVTWDLQEVQLPGMDSSMFNQMSGDVYSIDAQGETVVIAYFNDWGDSFIVKSTDNGDTWTKTTFLDFPVDKYTMDDGIDLDNDGVLDMVYSTDNYGTVILDGNGQAHVFAGNMAYIDDDLTDASSSWFPSTNGLLYWNESMGEDLTPPTVHAGDTSLWYSDLMQVIAQAPDLNGDSIVSGVDSTGGYALYYASRASMPSAGIAANGDIYVSFSGYTETASSGDGQVYRHIYIIKSTDGGSTWSTPVDVTPQEDFNGEKECIFGSMVPEVDNKIRIVYQNDYEPGLAVRGDEDLIESNDIVYLEVDITDITAITNVKNNNLELSVYPNPTTDATTLTINSEKTETINISIIDILGKTISTSERMIHSGINKEVINCANLESGVYFINTQIGDHKISKKLVITK